MEAAGTEGQHYNHKHSPLRASLPCKPVSSGRFLEICARPRFEDVNAEQ